MKPISHKITCQGAVELLSDYTSEPVSWRVRLVVRLHLRKCLGCSAYERQLVEILRACRTLEREEISEAQLRALLDIFAAQSLGHPAANNEQYKEKP